MTSFPARPDGVSWTLKVDERRWIKCVATFVFGLSMDVVAKVWRVTSFDNSHWRERQLWLSGASNTSNHIDPTIMSKKQRCIRICRVGSSQLNIHGSLPISQWLLYWLGALTPGKHSVPFVVSESFFARTLAKSYGFLRVWWTFLKPKIHLQSIDRPFQLKVRTLSSPCPCQILYFRLPAWALHFGFSAVLVARSKVSSYCPPASTSALSDGAFAPIRGRNLTSLQCTAGLSVRPRPSVVVSYRSLQSDKATILIRARVFAGCNADYFLRQPFLHLAAVEIPVPHSEDGDSAFVWKSNHSVCLGISLPL